jgi:hypothetical protein
MSPFAAAFRSRRVDERKKDKDMETGASLSKECSAIFLSRQAAKVLVRILHMIHIHGRRHGWGGEDIAPAISGSGSGSGSRSTLWPE